MINVTKSSMPSFEEYCNEIKELWDSHWITNMGIKHEMLQSQLEHYLECDHVMLYTNGHLALEGIIEAYDFPAGSEVVTTPFTFASTTHAIVRKGLVPVFCDINPVDYTIDVTKIESLITDKTVAILPVHVYGNVCDVDTIDAIAKKYNLKVIYDAAHAFGVRYRNIPVVNYGDASMLSFHATKVFNTIEGGAVCYKDDSMTQILKDHKNFGIRNKEEVAYVGGNAKMNEFQAAMGICNLRHVDDEIKKRETVFELYTELLKEIDGIRISSFSKYVTPNFAYFPVLFENFRKTRDEVYEELKKEGILTRKYFYPIASNFECYKSNHTVRGGR